MTKKKQKILDSSEYVRLHTAEQEEGGKKVGKKKKCLQYMDLFPEFEECTCRI